MKRRQLVQLALALGMGLRVREGACGYSTAQIEAALIYRMAGFIRWPQAFERKFQIGVFGNSDRYAPLRRLSETQHLHGVDVEVHQVPNEGPWRPVHLVYVSADRVRSLTRIAEKLAKQPVLIATHAPGATRLGAAVNFYEENGKSRFEINPDCLKRHQLSASYKLLSLARIVRDA